jgi:hypothetical protein
MGDEMSIRGGLPSWGKPGITLTLKMGKTSEGALLFGRTEVQPGDELFFVSFPKNATPANSAHLKDEQEIYWLSLPRKDLP